MRNGYNRPGESTGTGCPATLIRIGLGDAVGVGLGLLPVRLHYGATHQRAGILRQDCREKRAVGATGAE